MASLLLMTGMVAAAAAGCCSIASAGAVAIASQ
jgi:hypothetical protein